MLNALKCEVYLPQIQDHNSHHAHLLESVVHDCCLQDVCFSLKGRGVGWRGRCRQPESRLPRSPTQRRWRAGCARPSRERMIPCRILSSSTATRSAGLTSSTSHCNFRPRIIKFPFNNCFYAHLEALCEIFK